eukprot:3327389-Rhodomonas_salina.1
MLAGGVRSGRTWDSRDLVDGSGGGTKCCVRKRIVVQNAASVPEVFWQWYKMLRQYRGTKRLSVPQMSWDKKHDASTRECVAQNAASLPDMFL